MSKFGKEPIESMQQAAKHAAGKKRLSNTLPPIDQLSALSP
jgi:hypothetical protein